MSEADYDNEIATALRDLMDRCKALGMSFLAVVEWAPGEVGLSLHEQEERSAKFRLASIGARSFGNADQLIMMMLKDGKEHGHNSIYLHRLEKP